MWTVFDLILSNAITAKMPSSWRHLLTHSTMLGFLCLWGWVWYVSGVLWEKEYGLVWRTCLVLTLVFGSCLIFCIPLDGLVCVNKNCAHISERNLPKLESGNTYEAIAKDDFNVASQEDSYLGIAGTASNEVNLSVHNVDCFRSYFIKRYDGKNAFFLTVFTHSFNHVGVPVSLGLSMIC